MNMFYFMTQQAELIVTQWDVNLLLIKEKSFALVELIVTQWDVNKKQAPLWIPALSELIVTQWDVNNVIVREVRIDRPN